MGAAGMAIALCIGACSSSSSPTKSSGPSGSRGGSEHGSSLVVGQFSNLNNVASYRFTQSNVGAPGPGGQSPSTDGSYLISGTVINRPSASAWIRQTGAEYIVTGNLAWLSVDGTTWMASDPKEIDLTVLLPGSAYATWFDARASYFDAVGEESKNNVPCIHYKGNSTLASMYMGMAGASAGFQADVWIAKAGNYPVSGAYGYSAAAVGTSASWGFKFDITNIDDGANIVAAPTNVVALPTNVVASPTNVVALPTSVVASPT
jgi:hypothetical protein